MKRSLVGYDGSISAGHALARAASLANAMGASLTILTAASDRLIRGDGVETLAVDDSAAKRLAEAGCVLAREHGVSDVSFRVAAEAPGDALVAASPEFDLVVVGHRGLGALQELILGSTAKWVVDHVRTSVLVVR